MTADCRECGGLGWIVEPDGGQGSGHRCECSIPSPAALREALLASAQVPLDYRRREFRPPPTGAWSTWEGDPPALLLTGPTGVGKSMLAAELLHRRLVALRSSTNRSARGAWIRAGDVPDLAYSRDPEHRAALEDLREVAVLVIDELGRDHTGRAWEPVADLVSRRIEWWRPTIITSNLSVSALEAESPATGPLMDRLSAGAVVLINGKSKRRGELGR